MKTDNNFLDAVGNLSLLGDEAGYVRLSLKDKTPNSIAEALGNVLEALRGLRKLSLKEVSEKTDISVRRLTNIEEIGHGRMDSIFALCEVYKVNPTGLMQTAEVLFMRAKMSKGYLSVVS